MKLATSSVIAVVYLSLCASPADCMKKQIIKEVNICKRNDPHIQTCYCDHYNRIIPVIKNGVPEMNIVPIDPLQVENIRMELPKRRATEFRADLSDVILRGLSLGRSGQCNVDMTEDGIQLMHELVFPKIEMQSEYNVSAKLLWFAFHGHGKFYGNFTGMNVKSVWNSTRCVKHGKEHLKLTAKVVDLKMEKIQVHFTNLFGNVTEVGNRINELINANVDVLYNEIKPVVLQTIQELSAKLINNFYETFSFDDLFPKN